MWLPTWLSPKKAQPYRHRRSIRKSAPRAFRPCLEPLEYRRLLTVTIGYDPTTHTLHLEAANSTLAPAIISVSGSDTVAIIQTTGDTMSYASDVTPPSGWSLIPSGTGSYLTVIGIAPYNTPVSNLTISGPNGTTDTADTVTFNSFSSTTGDLSTGTGILNVSAGTINLAGSVSVLNATLTSVNSLTFDSTGVPYLGGVTIHAGPPTGQPFAGNPYITGPDWGTYGYAPGDTITISNSSGNPAVTGTATSFTVAAIVGKNLYLNSSYGAQFNTFLGTNLSKNLTSVTVACTGFTPQIQASVVSLNVTGAGGTISGALGGSALGGGFLVLGATTNNGNITLQDLPPVDTFVVLNGLNAGTGTIQLAVNGALVSTALVSSFPGPSFPFSTAPSLTAGAVNLTTTGDSGSIGSPSIPLFGGPYPITTTTPTGYTQSLKLTVATNSGGVYMQDSSPGGLAVNSILANLGGQAATVVDGQVVVNSTPDQSTPTYISAPIDFPFVTLTSSGPVALNSISSVGAVSITGKYLLEGNAQSQNIIAPVVNLAATGTAAYHGVVTFGQNANGDTLSLPTTGPTWTALGFVANDPIVISGALASADNGIFTVASVSTDGFTLILSQSFVLTPATQAGITVGNGIIGQASAAIALSSVPLFSAVTPNGDIFLDTGGGVNSTAVNVSAGGMHGVTNGVSLTSQGDFLTIQNITATGEASVTQISGSLIEYNGGVIKGQVVSLSSPFSIGSAASPFLTDATSALRVAATASSPTSAGIYVRNVSATPLASIGVRTYNGNVTVLSNGGSLLFNNNELSQTGAALVTFANTDSQDGSNGNVVISGTVHVSSIVAGIAADGTPGAGQILTNPAKSGTINGDNRTVLLSAGSGIGVPGTPLNITNLTALIASTRTGDIFVTNGTAPASSLTLSATTMAGNINVNWKGSINLASPMSNTAGVVLNSVSAPGTVTLSAVGAIANQGDSTVSGNRFVLTATGAIGAANSPLKTTSRGTPTLSATAGAGLFLDSSTSLNVALATAVGDLSVSAAGDLTLLGQVANATGNVTLTATGGTITSGNITSSAAAIATTGQKTVTPIVMHPYISVGADLVIDKGLSSQETVTITAVTATTFTATFVKTHAANFSIGTAITANSVSAASVAPITATVLTVTASQIGSPNNVIQTIATTINATAKYGGIYLSNASTNPLTLTAAAVGTSKSGVAPNNITIYSAGNIVLNQQTTALTQLATAVPVAVFTPGGVLILFAGATLNADGVTQTIANSSATITSTTTRPTATSLISQGAVTGVTFSAGSAGITTAGYTTAPTVTFSGGGGSGATARAIINANGQVIGFTITSGGSGYTSAPTITISPPGDDIYTGTYTINGITAITGSSPSYLRSLVIISNTPQVSISPGGTTGIPALVTLADLTTLALAAFTPNGTGFVALPFGTETVTNSGGVTTLTIEAGAITIDTLGQNGSSGTAVIPNGWSLVLKATEGSVVFLNLGDTLTTTGIGSTIIVSAGTDATDVAALGNLKTSGGAITVSAGGNVALGTLTAGNAQGPVSVTSTQGAILFSSASTPAAPNISASTTTLSQHIQTVPSVQSLALAQLHATQVIAAATASYAQAVSAVNAAGAQAAAELAAANALKAALTSIQSSVASANQTYRAAAQATNQAKVAVDATNATVTADLLLVTNLNIAAGSFSLITATLNEITAIYQLATAPSIGVPVVGSVGAIGVALFNVVASTFGLISATAGAAALSAQVDLNNDANALSNDLAILNSAQAAQAQAYAQLYADMDTQAALAAAYDVMEQAYAASQQAYTNAQATSILVEAAGDSNQALAIAGVVFASPGQPINATAPGSGPVMIQAHSPLTISADTTAADALTLSAEPDDPTGNDLTVVSGVTVRSTGSSVTLVAGNNIDIQSGSTIKAASAITITANAKGDPNGATVTVAGALIATSVVIGVDPNATGNETFTITPSATTPISVDGGSHSSGANTLNFNALGLPVTISGNTITAGTRAPVTFTNIQIVNITNEAGSSLMLAGTSGVANTMSLVGGGQQAGTATLNGIAFAFSGVTTFSYQGGVGDTIAVTPFAQPNVPWNLSVVIAGGAGAPANITYFAPAPDVTVMATGTRAGSIVEPGVATIPFSNVSQVTVVYQGISNVVILPNLTVSNAGGVYNGKPFSATVQINGAAKLDGITPTLTYYSGNLVISTHQLSGAPINAGTYTVVAAFAGNATYSSASVFTTFTIARGTPQVSVKPVTLTYGTALANSQLSGTATYVVNGASVAVPGVYSFTSGAGTVLAASASAYTKQVTFTPTDTTNYVTQTNLNVTVNVNKATPNVTVNTVNLASGTPLANSQLSGTATFIVNGAAVAVPGVYTYTSRAGTVLAARTQGYTEQVTFTPTDTTNYVTLTNLSVTVNVSLQPEIDVRGGGITIMNGDITPSNTDDTDFGNVDVNTGTLVKAYGIVNLGSAALNLTGTPLVQVTGANASDFTVTYLPPTKSIAVGNYAVFQITFNPSATGLRKATVSISNNDSDEGTFTFSVQGTGTGVLWVPEIDVRGGGFTIANGDTTPSVTDATDFGNVDVASGALVNAYGVVNLGNGALNLTGAPLVQISGANASDFTVTYLPPTSSIAAGSYAVFQITFNPSATGLRTATVSISNNDSDEGTFTFNIQGIGTGALTAPEIDVRGGGISIMNGDTTPSTTDDTDFGNVDVNTGAFVKAYGIVNLGNAALNLTGAPLVQISGANASDFTITYLPQTTSIAAGGYTVFQITFNPSATGLRKAMVSITSNDSDEGMFTFNIQGTGA